MKIPLTVKVTYRPGWGTLEGIREMYQNARDAEIQFSAPMEVRYRKDSKTLVFENKGTVLDRDALLLGHTSKEDDARAAGKFGEGLKLGMLALVRSGHTVKIRTGSEVWVPRIEKTDTFKSDVLVVEITPGRKDEKRVSVEIAGVSEDVWNALPELFLGLSKDKSDRVTTPNGTLLLGEKYRGRVFVKGIFVFTDPSLVCGYDFQDAETDSERKMIASYDLERHCRYVWKEALVTRPDLLKPFIGMLHESAKDISGIEMWSASLFSESVQKAVVEDFQARNGASAIPVSNLAESAEIEHYGRTGVITPKPLRAMLENVLGTSQDAKERLKKEAQKLYGWHELEYVEHKNIESAMVLVQVASPISLDEIEVTDFRDEGILGMFRKGKIFLARKILSNRKLTRCVLVHEVAHRNGGDGEKGHVEEIERIHSEIEEHLLGLQA